MRPLVASAALALCLAATSGAPARPMSLHVEGGLGLPLVSVVVVEDMVGAASLGDVPVLDFPLGVLFVTRSRHGGGLEIGVGVPLDEPSPNLAFTLWYVYSPCGGFTFRGGVGAAGSLPLVRAALGYEWMVADDVTLTLFGDVPVGIGVHVPGVSFGLGVSLRCSYGFRFG